MGAFSLSYSCDGRSACEGGCAIFLNVLDLRNNPQMEELFASIDDSLYARKINNGFQKLELAGLCGCDPGGIFLESRHKDLMDSGWALNWCGNPDSIVIFNDYSEGMYKSVVRSNSVLSHNISALKKFIKDNGCPADSVYEILPDDLKTENAKKGIYVTDLNIRDRDIVVPAYVQVLKSYHSNGKLANKIHFKKGKRDGADIWYYPIGKKFKVTNYKDGLRHGNEIQYDEFGRKKYEEPYRNGNLHGIKKYYDEKGRIRTKQKYEDGEEISLERIK
ncbi:toxin-antitoxin system YwqK family antitoxin [Fibrobacter sp. UWB11]|uniref:toxin-antitoxin system YwqK family antitoxin n=1 Tax=Fibrobacter sp. UWB11 TaxID=1896202 RepID=UPI001588015B|nr:toxin-antitoxin system YwqK family antitoxin [Fibrobacter sp. UWB11]